MAEEEMAPPKGDSNGEVIEQEEEDHSSSEEEEEDILKLVKFAKVRPVDIPRCVEIEKASYPPDEAASKSSLQYRQHHAANYFRCALIGGNAGDMNVRGSLVDDEDREVIGFICATRCHEFVHEAMSTHHSDGPLLAIHSVVVTEEHRRIGIATAMLTDYVETMRSMQDDGVQKLVLMAKKNLLSFYVDSGFSVTRPSPIVHGKDKWYELELDLSSHKSTGCPYSIVDSFANVEVPGSGNPAAVVILESKDVDLEDPDLAKWMLLVSKEFNLSETAFVWQHENYKQGKQRHWYIRYFTPTLEVDLCGHATLAAAGIVYRTLSTKSSDTKVVFHAKKDILTTKLSPGGPRWVKKRPHAKIAMQFPIKQPEEIKEPETVSAVEKMLWEALKVPSDVILFIGHTGIGDVFVELAPDAFERIGYNNIQYNAFCGWDGYTRGVVVCCCARRRSTPESADGGTNDTASNAAPSNNNTTTPQTPEAAGMETPDFFSRFFAPKAGINEDPATGSAHCSLGPYFSKKLGKERVLGKQTSERGAIVECRCGGGDDSTVTIIGVGVQTMTGNLLL